MFINHFRAVSSGHFPNMYLAKCGHRFIVLRKWAGVQWWHNTAGIVNGSEVPIPWLPLKSTQRAASRKWIFTALDGRERWGMAKIQKQVCFRVVELFLVKCLDTLAVK